MFKEIEVLLFEEPAEHTYAEFRADLERRGLPTGANNLYNAAHARNLGGTLVTANERAFSRLKGLKIENWLR